MLRHTTTSLQQALELKRCGTRDLSGPRECILALAHHSNSLRSILIFEHQLRGVLLKHSKGEGIGIQANIHSCNGKDIIDVKITAFLTTSLRAGST